MAKSTPSEELYFNGINGTTGKPSLPPMKLNEFVASFIDYPLLPEDKAAGQYYKHVREVSDFAPADDRDPKLLNKVGWGVIFAEEEDPAVIEALQPLLQLRQEQAGEYFYAYAGRDGQRRGYTKGEDKINFLQSRGAEPFGPADPNNAPYYLLLVGDPAKIPFPFQYELDVQYAIGRLHFDRPEAYAQYAQNVVLAETGKLQLPRKATFFGVDHDNATHLSAEHLIKPLAEELTELIAHDKLNWTLETFLKEQATKSALTTMLNGPTSPTLLFTASHGVHFDIDDKRLRNFQGALLCPDDPEKMHDFRDESYYFAAQDLTTNANLLGLMAFHFACYSAGSPIQNDFLIGNDRRRPPLIAPYPFIARLPQQLLLNGALAVIGHIERAWTYSISFSGENRADNKHLATFRSTMRRLFDGHPIGSALEFVNEKYGEYSTALSRGVEAREMNRKDAPDDLAIAKLWMANNDARNFIIVGDPAVRLPIATEPDTASTERPPLARIQSAVYGSANMQSEATTSSQLLSQSNTLVTPHSTVEADSYGLREVRQSIQTKLSNVAAKVEEILNSTLENVTTLEVLTYTSNDDLRQAYDTKTKQFHEQAVLKAVTQISYTGDISHMVPVVSQSSSTEERTASVTEIDEQLWAIHREMVETAQKNKIEFFKAVAEVACALSRLAL